MGPVGRLSRGESLAPFWILYQTRLGRKSALPLAWCQRSAYRSSARTLSPGGNMSRAFAGRTKIVTGRCLTPGRPALPTEIYRVAEPSGKKPATRYLVKQIEVWKTFAKNQ